MGSSSISEIMFFLRGLSAYLQTNPSMGMSHMGTTWLCPKIFPKIIQVVQRDPLRIWWVSKSTKHELRCPTGELSSGKSNKKSEHDLPFTKGLITDVYCTYTVLSAPSRHVSKYSKIGTCPPNHDLGTAPGSHDMP